MNPQTKSIRPFLGARDYEQSRRFYRDLGFEEVILFHNMCLFKTQEMGFYLQDAYVKDWIDNTMVFLEVQDVEYHYNELLALDLPAKYESVRLLPVQTFDWGRECYLHDPSGILWHIGEFSK